LTVSTSAHSPREDFPWATRQVYLNNAGLHPIPVAVANALDRFRDHWLLGPGPANAPETPQQCDALRELYARLIGASAVEIALVPGTLWGENVVAAGLGLDGGGGNIVTDELHYHGGIHLYRELAARGGPQVRIVRQRDWRSEIEDFEALIDDDTRLVAITLVSNINGFQQDARALSAIAHAHGAYLYADVIQAAGCVPLDVRALGIDFCTAGSYKWLMGVKGLGFLYVREGLLDTVQRRYFGEEYTDMQYHWFPGSPPGPGDISFRLKPGAAKFEICEPAPVAVAASLAALEYIHDIGVPAIQDHARPLTARLLEEVPRRGYPRITPPGTAAPLTAFRVDDAENLQARLAAAGVRVKIKWHQMRVSPSVFNDDGDVDALLAALRR
jgi:selenocysteine lyase/cysteine desulfurase